MVEELKGTWTLGGRPLNAVRRAEARLTSESVLLWEAVAYQLPLDGQAPVFTVVQVRTGAPPAVFVMMKSLPDFE